MHNTFQSLLQQGYDVFGIFLSSGISGTFQSAVQGREMLDKDASRIVVLDSLGTTMAMGLPVLTAARAAQAGKSLVECQKVAENAFANDGVLFVVETLEFLRRGGRLGGAQALLGTALNLKPSLAMQEGWIESVERIRTKHKATQRVVNIVGERVKGRSPVRLAVTHASSEADALHMLKAGQAVMDPFETMGVPLSPVTGTHAGPGTVALNFMCGVA